MTVHFVASSLQSRQQNAQVYDLKRYNYSAVTGFTLNRVLFGKKCGDPSPGAADPIFPEKNWRSF